MLKVEKSIIVIIISSLIGFTIILFTPYHYYSTTLLLLSPDGKDISDQIEVNVWIPEKYIDKNEEIYSLQNFNLLFKNVLANKVKFDCKKYGYIWVEIDPLKNSNYTNEFFLLVGYSNNVFIINLHKIFN